MLIQIYFVFYYQQKLWHGMGNNLNAAETCIIHDIDFNPYDDKQAVINMKIKF